MLIKRKISITTATLALALCSALPAMAAVSAADADKLKSTLTPLGAEKAGNADGTIPAWDGGFKGAAGAPGEKRADPFAGEKPLFSITPQNMDQYADKLSDGVKAMLKKYPDTFRVDVYETHRTASAPQWVYDNTYNNALTGKLNGTVPENIYGGIPFPIPQTGAEVIWNHILRWGGSSFSQATAQYLFTADGKKVTLSSSAADMQVPYYFKDGSWDEFSKDPGTLQIKVITTAPAIRAGEASVFRWELDTKNDQAWTYLAGQRRVRKIPNPCCDSPNPTMGGMMSIDEAFTWNGPIDRFNWDIVGKQEMYIPYNSNLLQQPDNDDAVLSPNHLNPDYVRWELHRVWVVDATLAEGKRHTSPKSRYYCDEDTWMCVLGDRQDANGELWKVVWYIPFVAPDLPGIVGGTFGIYDLISGNGVASAVYNEGKEFTIKPRYDDEVFTPDALAADGVR